MQNNYSNKIYEIIKVNKNTVKLDNDEIVKKSNLLIIDKNRLLSSDELDSNHEKINAEKDHKIFYKLKKLDMNNII